MENQQSLCFVIAQNKLRSVNHVQTKNNTLMFLVFYKLKAPLTQNRLGKSYNSLKCLIYFLANFLMIYSISKQNFKKYLCTAKPSQRIKKSSFQAISLCLSLDHSLTSRIMKWDFAPIQILRGRSILAM